MNYQRVVILKEKEGERYLPCWIGTSEADAIAVKLQGVSVPRPLTHDFTCAVIDALGVTVECVVISELKKDTFYAKVILDADDEKMEIDSRPSDALAVAVRVGAPIFADEKVLKKAGVRADEETGKLIQSYEPESDRVQIFSESAQGVMDLAEEEAKRLNHNFISTGHLLLALVKSVPTAACQALSNLAIDLTRIPVEIETLIRQSTSESSEPGLSSALKKAIELSIMEMKLTGGNEVKPEHMLLGLVRQSEGIAGNLLKDKGINVEKILYELIRLYYQSSYEQRL